MKKSIFLSLCLFLVGNTVLLAQWTNDTAQNTPVTVATDFQYLSSHGYSKYHIYRCIPDGNDGMIIAWASNISDKNIFAQRLDSNGNPVWTENGISVCSADDTQNYPAMITNDSGDVIICWEDRRSGVSGSAIYAQKLNIDDGSYQWTENGEIVCDASSYESSPVIVSDGNNGAIICWEDKRNGNYDIYAQQIDTNGTTQWSSDLRLSTISSHDWEPMMISDGSNGAIVSWRADDNKVYAQRISNSGTKYWEQTVGAENPIYVSTWVVSPRDNPVLCSDGAGGAIIAWRGGNPVSNTFIYAQRINSSGTQSWSSQDVKLSDMSSGSQSSPTIASDNNGGAIITWVDYRNSNYDIYAQKVDSNGNRVWDSEGIEVCIESGTQYDPTIVSDGNGGAIICWEDRRTSTDYDIYAQRFLSGNGSAFWSSEIICNATDDQSTPLITTDGNNNALICWGDMRNMSSTGIDIYAQTVLASGNIPISMELEINATGSYNFIDAECTMNFSTITGSGNVNVLQIPDYPGAANPATSADVYWRITDSSDISAFTTSITFTYSGHIGSMNEADLKVFRNGSRGWEEWSDFSLDTINDEITANNVTAFSDWTIATEDTPLPVTLSSFYAVYSNDNLSIKWTTESEVNNAGWNIYRSLGDINEAQQINSRLIQSEGNSSQTCEYIFWDTIPLEQGQMYHYWLESVSFSGETNLFGPTFIFIEQQEDDQAPDIPIVYGLQQNYPNPFNPSTTITFALEEASHAELAVYNFKGQKVVTLYKAQTPSDRYISVEWDGLDSNHKKTSSGTYMMKLHTQNETFMKKMILLK